MTTYGFTGTREGMTDRQKAALTALLAQSEFNLSVFHHGRCRGADVEAAELAHPRARVVAHPSNSREWDYGPEPWSDEVLGAKPPLERNLEIVLACDVLIAAPQTLAEQPKGGTWWTIRFARKLGKPCVILEP